ncbi:MAG: hypothetical protein Q9190_002050 [Brigantiaea leucoxantha]
MAANYWASTQRRHWLFSRESLRQIRQDLEDEDRDLIKQYPMVDRRLLSIFFNQQLGKLGKRIGIKQQALATAQIYIRRFYIKVDIRYTNPYLILATALYLACKMEETPHHIKTFSQEARIIWPDLIPSDVSKLGECEFYLISELNSQLIVHHPHRTLENLRSTLELAQDEMSLAWSVINDHYLTDLPLLVPPHVIAISAVFLAMTLKTTQGGLQAAAGTVAALANALPVSEEFSPAGATTLDSPQEKMENLVNWLAEGGIEIQVVVDCSQEIVSLYDIWEQYNEKTCREQVARLVKSRALDK